MPATSSIGVEEVKDLQWILSSLWLAVGSKETGGVLINLPDTALFLGGEPSKWIGTNEDGK